MQSIWRFTYDSTTTGLSIWTAAWMSANKSGDMFLSHSLEELGCKGLTESWKYWGKKKLFWNLICQAALGFIKSEGSEWTQQIWGTGEGRSHRGCKKPGWYLAPVCVSAHVCADDEGRVQLLVVSRFTVEQLHHQRCTESCCSIVWPWLVIAVYEP